MDAQDRSDGDGRHPPVAGDLSEPELESVSAETEEWQQQYWRRNLRLIVTLLALWALVSYVFGILLVEPLNDIVINGFPLGFWFAQQGSIYTFVVLILVYCLRMDRLDEEFGVSERDEEGNRR